MEIPFGRPIIGPEEKDAVMKVLESPILVHGPLATQFENDFAAFVGAPQAISVSSCTAGMHLIYFALGLGAGDEVVVPAMTHVATAHAVELTGARAVFVDCRLEDGNIDVTKIEAALSPRTKALAVVHYLGVPVDMPEVVAIAKKHNLFLVEDCALAPGARVDGVHAGLHGDAGVFSFYPVKHMTTAEGGMIILKDDTLAKRLRLLKAFGVDRTHGDRKVPGIYDAVALGFNYRMSEVHAAIGIEQVKKLPDFLKTRKANFETLEQGLAGQKGLRVLPQPAGGRLESCHYCLSILLDEPLAIKRAGIMAALTDRKIGSSVYYPQPVPRMTYYRDKYGYDAHSYPNAARISDGTVALPVGPHLGVEHMKHIAANLREIVNGVTT